MDAPVAVVAMDGAPRLRRSSIITWACLSNDLGLPVRAVGPHQPLSTLERCRLNEAIAVPAVVTVTEVEAGVVLAPSAPAIGPDRTIAAATEATERKRSRRTTFLTISVRKSTTPDFRGKKRRREDSWTG